MKTAMQELIEELEKRMKSYLSVDMALSASAIAITLMEAKKLLKKEKEQIIDASNSAFEDKTTWGERYYNQTYNNGI
jgi:6-phosphogluconate dehydrogenase (decarboxylating)